MVDTFGWRCKFGVITPSTNTIVQPDYDDRRPVGVTNHISRMHIPDEPVKSDADFNELIRRIDVALEGALERVLTCKPDHIVLGISAESIWGGGLKPAEDIVRRIRLLAGPAMKVTQAAYAFPAALQALGVMPGATIGLVTPYFPVAAKHLKEYVEAIGSKEPYTTDYIVECTKENDIRRDLFFAMAKMGKPILMLKPMDVTLEDIFIQVTTADEEVS